VANTALNRTVVALLTNKSGGNLAYGDTVIIDTANAKAFTTTTTSGYTATGVGVIIEPNGIASNATGLVATAGWVPKITLNAAATIGQFIKTHTVAGQSTPHSTQATGDFGYALQASATPEAILWGGPNSASGVGLTDSDYGDITVGGTGTTMTIDNDAVTYAKMQNISATSRLLGRKTAGAGDTEECTLSEALDFVGSAAQGDILYRGAATWTRLGAGTNGHYLQTQGAGANPQWAAASAAANHNAYTYITSMTEPLAIEQLRSGAFSYAIDSSTTKLVLNAYKTRLGSAGRWEVRDPRMFQALRGVTITGLGADSAGVIINPSAATYTDARDTYLDRLETIATTSTKYLQQSTANSRSLFLPGPYGTIITSVNAYNATWVVIRASNTASGIGWNLHDEMGDAAAQALNFAHPAIIPVSKYVCAAFELGTLSSQGGADAEGSLTYIICPDTWGKVTDSTSYNFRDDFMGASLDTGTDWTRAESTAGNVEIDTDFAWLKLKGNGTWGQNGCFSQTTVARANGKVFQCDVYVPLEGSVNTHNTVVGWHDGAGQSYSDFAHGLDFTTSAGVRRLQAFELGVSRGLVGTNPGYTEGYIYRVRITLTTTGATWEIQGGTEYQPLGGSAWTDITPAGTSDTTTPLAIGCTREQTGSFPYYIGDMKMY
jgi:hypothetical protein